MHGAIPPLRNTSLWRGAQLKHRDKFTLMMMWSMCLDFMTKILLSRSWIWWPRLILCFVTADLSSWYTWTYWWYSFFWSQCTVLSAPCTSHHITFVGYTTYAQCSEVCIIINIPTEFGNMPGWEIYHSDVVFVWQPANATECGSI
jgi:hypothetical protein